MPPMQAEHVAGFEHRRPDRVVAAHFEREFVLDRLGLLRPQIHDLDALPFHAEPRPAEHALGEQVFDEHPEDGQASGVAKRDGHFERVADFARRVVAAAFGSEIFGPPSGEEPAEEIDAQQDVPCECNESGLQGDGKPDEKQDDDEPAHGVGNQVAD